MKRITPLEGEVRFDLATCDSLEAGSIRKHLENGKKLTSDAFILGMVLFSEIPIEDQKIVQNSIRRNQISGEEFPVIEEEIQRLEKMKVIEKSIHEEGEIISPIFSVFQKQMGHQELF